MHNHHDQSGAFPCWRYCLDLLPFLEQSSVGRSFSNGHVVPDLNISGQDVDRMPGLSGVDIPTYSCPSDFLQAEFRGRITSYPMNFGTGFLRHQDAFRGASGNKLRNLGARDVTDGLSSTVVFSEKLLHGRSDAPSRPLMQADLSRVSRLRIAATTDAFHEITQRSQFAEACVDAQVWLPGYCGPIFLIAAPPKGYNHILPPNHNSCVNGLPEQFNVRAYSHSAITATSLHAGGVNALLADGSARFFSENIDRTVWEALGTRNGGEVISEF